MQPDSSGCAVDSSEDNNASKGSPSTTDDCMGEHAYSLNVPKFDDREFIFNISSEIRKEVEELLMEGDLLEVSLDETLHLWKLLQVTKDPEKEVTLIDFDVSIVAVSY